MENQEKKPIEIILNDTQYNMLMECQLLINYLNSRLQEVNAQQNQILSVLIEKENFESMEINPKTKTLILK